MPVVSVIIPLFNSEDYLGETLDSLLAQTFLDWEAILVDDASSDDSFEVASRYSASDSRFRVLRQSTNMGAAKARNRALGQARGRYIAYLDSDDYWFPDKLEAQIDYMTRNSIGACFTSYETVNEDGSHRNYVHVDKLVSYRRFLKKPPTCSHTIMFDTQLVSRVLLEMPDIRKRQDAATWLRVIRSVGPLHGYDEVLAANRKRAGSLSANKVDAVRNTWRLYTEVEQLKKPYAAYCLFWQMFHATTKRLGKI
ncbi:glycosyltransferase family 2 protein [Actinomycetaceae bacterium L2_0104]